MEGYLSNNVEQIGTVAEGLPSYNVECGVAGERLFFYNVERCGAGSEGISFLHRNTMEGCSCEKGEQLFFQHHRCFNNGGYRYPGPVEQRDSAPG